MSAGFSVFGYSGTAHITVLPIETETHVPSGLHYILFYPDPRNCGDFLSAGPPKPQTT